MARDFKETAHLNTDRDKYNSNFDKIFGKNCKKKDCSNKVKDKSDEYCEECNSKKSD